MRISILLALTFVTLLHSANAQTQHPFYFGSDLSYVNEMEDCGAVFYENSQPKDVYQIFKDHKTNLARFRLWHTPSFYDTLNMHKRYSDFADVRKSMGRAKAAGMHVLLDFHLSDFWADPSRQIIPKAWEPVAGNLPVLKDSLYNHVYQTLMRLHQDGLMPEMVQIGNETNKGIMLTPAQDATGFVLNWPRNAALFKRAIEAVRDAETASGKDIRVALHIADPSDAGWLMQGFWSNGVQDFDVIGLSYYWAWHKPVTIAQTGNIITQLRNQYPGKSVMIFETGYIWTTASNDQAANIISEVSANYAPASPANQRKWMVDLTQEVINRGGEGVMYWEPAWVSTTCRTPWGQGSHQEHATFFDFNENTLLAGGMTWPEHTYTTSIADEQLPKAQFWAYQAEGTREINLRLSGYTGKGPVRVEVMDSLGVKFADTTLQPENGEAFGALRLENVPMGMYFIVAHDAQNGIYYQRLVLKK
jgi:arabinogalactan endo-1,4-beta-galactosidase